MSHVDSSTFNEGTVRAWMLRHLEEHHTGELSWKRLGEAAAGFFGKDYDDGPLDDHSHWIWDLAIEVDERHGRLSSSGSC
jgi:hypothetical protein